MDLVRVDEIWSFEKMDVWICCEKQLLMISSGRFRGFTCYTCICMYIYIYIYIDYKIILSESIVNLEMI